MERPLKKPCVMAEENEFVVLISKEGKEFQIERSAALRSGQIADLIQTGFEEATTNKFQLNEISNQTLELLVPLLPRLDELLKKNEAADAMNQIYIPRRYQPFINDLLRNVKDQEIVELYQAADLLDLPFILNGVASVIANRMEKEIDTAMWLNLTALEQNNLVQERAILRGIYTKHKYILKHITLRKDDITQEASIADYIAQHGQPQFDTDWRGPDCLRLYSCKITSLFGIHMLQLRSTCKILFLNNNRFFDIALDVQSTPKPFKDFEQLQTLDLTFNKLENLPKDIFAGLAQLRELLLSVNQLNNLPEHLFKGLAQLQDIDLTHNVLSNLPEHLFDGLAELRALSLDRNQWTPDEMKIIRARLPNVKTIF